MHTYYWVIIRDCSQGDQIAQTGLRCLVVQHRYEGLEFRWGEQDEEFASMPALRQQWIVRCVKSDFEDRRLRGLRGTCSWWRPRWLCLSFLPNGAVHQLALPRSVNDIDSDQEEDP